MVVWNMEKIWSANIVTWIHYTSIYIRCKINFCDENKFQKFFHSFHFIQIAFRHLYWNIFFRITTNLIIVIIIKKKRVSPSTNRWLELIDKYLIYTPIWSLIITIIIYSNDCHLCVDYWTNKHTRNRKNWFEENARDCMKIFFNDDDDDDLTIVLWLFNGRVVFIHIICDRFVTKMK